MEGARKLGREREREREREGKGKGKGKGRGREREANKGCEGKGSEEMKENWR